MEGVHVGSVNEWQPLNRLPLGSLKFPVAPPTKDARLALGFPGLGASPGSESFHFSYISRNCPSVQVKSCTMGLGQERHVSELHVLRGRRQNKPSPSAPDAALALAFLSFRITDPAVGCTLALIAMVQTGTGAVPGPQPLGALLDAGGGGCHLAQFKSLSPQELRANLLPSLCPDLTPRPRLFPRTWDLWQLQVWERPVALEAELALTLKVLGTVADGSQGDILDQPLHTLRHMHSELQAVSAQSEAGPRPQGRLHHRVQCLHEAPKKSLGCLEASVLFNLFRLLTRDLKCVASGDLCV
ncbi:interferon lambda-3-like [Lynx rufus]|uniref:interferon lambda-3-like n=1 Tax=Lynx rufus TaxID=61384 RepID=UPI001F1252C3|nr:interferon lambda-3-like [Lynx rufus]